MTDAVKMAIAEQAANLTVPADGKFGGPCTYKRLWYIARDAALAVLEKADADDEHSDDCGCMLCRTEAHHALEQAGEPVAKLHYSGDVMEAVQQLLERGRATLDSDGYLVSLPVEQPITTLQRLGQEFDGEGEDYAELKLLYNFSDDDSAQFTRWNMLAAIRHGKKLSTPTPAQVEPVAVIGKDWALHWASADSLKDIVDRTGIKIGSPLYASPPARLGQEGDKGEGWQPIETAPTDDSIFWVGMWEGELLIDEHGENPTYEPIGWARKPIWTIALSHHENPQGPHEDRGWNHRNGPFSGYATHWWKESRPKAPPHGLPILGSTDVSEGRTEAAALAASQKGEE